MSNCDNYSYGPVFIITAGLTAMSFIVCTYKLISNCIDKRYQLDSEKQKLLTQSGYSTFDKNRSLKDRQESPIFVRGMNDIKAKLAATKEDPEPGSTCPLSFP